MSVDHRSLGMRWAGALQILRFNWPAYLSAVVFALICCYGLTLRKPLCLIAATALLPTLYFTVASLLASHWVYDLSPLADWAWLPEWLGAPVGCWMLIQTGFDSTHGRLRQRLSSAPLAVVDLYGVPGVGGASVRRARKENKEDRTAVSALPVDSAVCDTALAVFALHEIQNADARMDFFRGLARTLRPGGRLVVVEHLRDWKNFIVFGLGCFHFLPEREWRRCGALPDLRFENECSITPFVRVFLWSKQ